MSFESLPSFGSVFGDQFAFETNAHVRGEEVCFESFNSGKWTAKEEEAFNHAVSMYGIDNVPAIQAIVRTRSKVQVRNRTSKLKIKLGNKEYDAARDRKQLMG